MVLEAPESSKAAPGPSFPTGGLAAPAGPPLLGVGSPGKQFLPPQLRGVPWSLEGDAEAGHRQDPLGEGTEFHVGLSTAPASLQPAQGSPQPVGSDTRGGAVTQDHQALGGQDAGSCSGVTPVSPV